MRVSLSYATDRAEPALIRVLDLDERRLHLALPWDITPSAALAAVAAQTTPEEYTALARALDPGGAA